MRCLACSLFALLAACDPQSGAVVASSAASGAAVTGTTTTTSATSASASATGTTSAGGGPALEPPRRSALPAERDAEAAKLVKAGAACKLENDAIDSACPERTAAGEYAFAHQQSVAIAATCAELLRDKSPAVKLVASHCLYKLTAVALTPVLADALDTLEAEPNVELQRSMATGISRAEAVTAKLEDRVLALVEKLAATPERESAAGSVLDTLFRDYLLGSAPKPPLAAQKFVLTAFARKKGALFTRACDLVRLVDDKPAACAAVAGGIVEGSTDYWRALSAFSSLGAPCAEHAPAVLAVALAHYDKDNIDAPQEMRRFGETFELTPALRKDAATRLTAAAKRAPKFKLKEVSAAADAFAKPWTPPKP